MNNPMSLSELAAEVSKLEAEAKRAAKDAGLSAAHHAYSSRATLRYNSTAHKSAAALARFVRRVEELARIYSAPEWAPEHRRVAHDIQRLLYESETDS